MTLVIYNYKEAATNYEKMTIESDRWKNSRVVYRHRPRGRGVLLDKRRLYALGVVAAIAIFVALAYGLLHIPAIQISEVRVEGVETLDAGEIENAVRQILSGDRYHFIPRANIVLFSPRWLELLIREQYPAISSLVVKKQFPDLVSLTLEERHLWAVYCALAPAEASAEAEITEKTKRCFFIDQKGIAYREAPSLSGNLILTIYGPLGETEEGDQIITERMIGALEAYRNEIHARIGSSVSSFTFKENAPKDVWIRVREGFDIIAVRDDVPAKVAELVRLALEEKGEDSRDRLAYVDARFGSKLFLKYR